MVVHSCFVDDTNGDRVDLIDGSGCANDLYLLNNLEYPADLEAGIDAHVFKYADRADLYFQCQITILVKVHLTAAGISGLCLYYHGKFVPPSGPFRNRSGSSICALGYPTAAQDCSPFSSLSLAPTRIPQS